MKFRKITVVLTILVMMMTLLTGCGTNAGKMSDDKINVVCTIFPQYDWIREIVGDVENIEVTLLLKNGTDMHSYQATADDIITVSNADVFIYVGGASDAWVDNALKQAANPDMKVVNMMDILGDSLKEEEIVEGMESEHDHDDEEHSEGDVHDENGDHEEHSEDIEYDEHVWLSLNNSITLCNSITEVMCEVDAANRAIYEENCKTYVDKLSALDKEYKNVVENSKYDTILFGDRFPFVYMVKDYGINYYAAFVGCSAETEASFETVTFLAERLNEYGLPVVLTVEGSNQSLAKTIVENSKEKNQTILTMNSMQSVTEADINNGATYISIMQDNLKVLEQALGGPQ